MKKYSHIFFDLDGTLTQSEFGIIRSAKHAVTAKRIIDHYGLDDRFSAVIGPDKSEKSPDKKMLIERAIAEKYLIR